MKSVYDTAPWRGDANVSLEEKNKESKLRQQLNKVQDETLRHLRSQKSQKSRPIMEKKRAEQSLSTRRTMTTKHLFASNLTQLVDYDGFHPQYLIKEEKLERRDDKRVENADAKGDLFESSFKGWFSGMPAYSDFVLPNAEELARTPRHSSSDAADPTEDPGAGQVATKTPPRWIAALATLSPDQVTAKFTLSKYVTY